MTNKVLKTISEHKMTTECDVLGVGLSGGADSVCLAHVLIKNKDVLGIKSIKGIHIHHGIRGEEADRDLDFCRNFCETYGIDFFSYKADIPAIAKKTGESLEECARRVRYSFFEESECDKIATAHNLNDNMETFIFNLSRGTSLSGLCGIPYVRDIYIRPLLDCSRNEIEEYLSENNLEYVIDSTNLCDDYTRNKIRHNIIPQLFLLNPSFDSAFLKCNQSLNMSKDYIMQNARKFVNESTCDGYYDCTTFENCHNALKFQIVSLILKENDAKNISREHINAVIGIMKNGGSTDVGGNVTVNVERKRMFFGKKENVGTFERKVDFTEKEIETIIGTFGFEIIVNKDLQNLNKRDMDNLIDYDKISNGALIRNRVEGDFYKLPNRPGKTLKKLFNENKVSVYEREKMLIISDDEGIVWTEYFGVADRCKIDDGTQRILLVKRKNVND